MKHGFRGTPKIGLWDYDCSNPPPLGYKGRETFSVGIFQWVPMAGAWMPSHIKRGKGVCRVHGPRSAPGRVYEFAEELCKSYDAGIKPLQKSYTVKRWAK